MLKRSKVPQGLIASAHGGTCMELWDPGLRDQGENSLYGAMYNRIMNCGGKVAGLLWYQGCSDTEPEIRTELYEKRTLQLFKALRKDLSAPKLPIIMVQLGRTMLAFNQNLEASWSKIREIQRKMPRKLSRLAVVPAIDLANDDTVHLSCSGHRTLAHRLADALEYLNGKKEILPPITLGKVSCRKNPVYGDFEIVLNFNNVAGKLQSGDNLPSGFSIHHSGKQNCPATPPFRCTLRGKSVILSVSGEIGPKVAYGFGCNPAVNIHDEAGRSLPAFGPIYYQPTPKSTPMLSKVEISEPFMGDDSYDTLLPVPERLELLKFNKYEANSTYITPKRLVQQGKYTYYIRWQVNCQQASNIIALTGSDGPFRLTCDGKEVAGFAQVANPIVPDEFSIPLELSAGKHEFILGLGGKSGNAWGFCLRYIDPEEFITIENESLPSAGLPELL
jgi:sialate O-acetylesterase